MEQNLQELYNWVDSHTITRPKRNLNRDFSDAVPLAEILKAHFPKMVEIHNYGPKNAVSKKISNWYTLNRKVLSKLNVHLTDSEIDSISQSIPGAIENVLFRVKAKVEKHEEEQLNKALFDADNSAEKDEKKRDTMIPIDLLDKQNLELDIKNDTIEILNRKVSHMQVLLKMKDEQITELQQKLDEYLTKENGGSGFFTRFMK